ncbi:BatD family protein [Luteimonas sp. MC1895]|uniref:BatD family protein n=1 Tax=Luteimonas sp. MC1895 TaxID=2819513 RepID=UPI0018F0C768|nr:BatD family protein [Luteimonas sp. MC1895]MBJ6980299.1 BatD family protein [Luteimonas sp. MC1895]
MSNPSHSRLGFARVLLALVLALAPALASAEVRAWLDRDRIELGETVTLNIEVDTGGRPDYGPLAGDFRIEQRSSRQSFELRNGQSVSRTLHAVALQPLRGGVLTVPALAVGGERTAPLTLTVAPASVARPPARGPAFIEAEVDDPSPYVQQAVGLRLRLYYSVQLLSGQLDQPAVDGLGLQRAGSDLQYTREVGGRRFQVVERRYLLIPERSGRIELPAATFRGRGVGGWLDDLFGDGQRALSADGPAIALEVRPVPPAAPRPWLPLHGLQLRWLQAPDAARAGDAFTVELELVADGATAAQLEMPMLAADAGAQVFPEPAQHDETIEDGRPRVRMVRRYSVLPARDGPLRIEAPAMGWWDVGANRAREATLPALEVDVAPAAGAVGAGGTRGTVGTGAARGIGTQAADDSGPWVRLPGVQGPVHRWALATVVFALLWLLTLAWGLQWRQRGQAAAGAALDDGIAGAKAVPRARGHGAALRKSLDTGDLGEVSVALCALASPPAADLDALSMRLVPGPQREAIDQLQRARWGQDGDGAAQARATVRAAFARGADWIDADEGGDALLPPHYPR